MAFCSRRIFFSLCCMFFVLLSFVNEAQAKTLVRVVAYPFPPFVLQDMKSGLTSDILALLNKSQDEFEFELSVKSAKRRYFGFQKKKQDMILFEMPQWGWHDIDVKFSTTREMMRGGEVYIAHKKRAINQSYFDELPSKHIGAHFGYHYHFANFNTKRAWLEKHFRILLTHSQSRIIDLILKRKIDIGVVTLSYLKQYRKKHPEIKNDLLVSEKMDQEYSLKTLIREGSPLSVEQFEALLDKLVKDGSLPALLKKNGLLGQFTF